MGGFYERVGKELSLYAKQIAWLNTAPDPPTPPKGQKPQKQPTRLQRFRAEGMPIELPDNPAPYITDWLMEIGPVSSSGMGPVPLSWGDIQSWQDLTGNDLDPWEARTIRSLSKDFLTQMTEAKASNCAPPYSTGPNDEAVSDQFAAMFAAMKARQDEKNSKRRKP